MKENFRFVIVGHVDHGKSTLIGRLFFDTGCLPEEKINEVKQTCESLGKEMEFAFVMDHLEEEREQGITIDTSQTFFSTKKRDYTIIDAPGHVEFTKNMITGASQAEAALLIVDADEGVKEQTRRHAYILSLLGLKQVIVVVNKMDLVEYSESRFNEIKNDILNFLNELNISPSYVIPISAKEGPNVAKTSDKMPWYVGQTILTALDTFESGTQKENQPLRMPIQDVYKIGDKRIMVGRVETGKIDAGQDVLLLPSGFKTKIKSVEAFLNSDKTTASAGESIGVTFTDPLFTDRGQVICTEENVPKKSKEITGKLFWMSNTPLKKGETVKIKCATQERSCVIKEIYKRLDSSTLQLIETDAAELKNREVGEILFEVDSELIIDDFNKNPAMGRFVIEKDFDTAGGGIVT